MKPDTKFLRDTEVILTDDLTRYHKSLIKGIVGITVGKATQSAFMSGYNDRFVKVKFPEITIDILWKGLEPTDQ
jgi:hypothetical protein